MTCKARQIDLFEIVLLPFECSILLLLQKQFDRFNTPSRSCLLHRYVRLGIKKSCNTEAQANIIAAFIQAGSLY